MTVIRFQMLNGYGDINFRAVVTDDRVVIESHGHDALGEPCWKPVDLNLIGDGRVSRLLRMALQSFPPSYTAPVIELKQRL